MGTTGPDYFRLYIARFHKSCYLRYIERLQNQIVF